MAFSVGDQGILLAKLENYGLKNKNAHERFESYLSGREQVTDINGKPQWIFQLFRVAF